MRKPLNNNVFEKVVTRQYILPLIVILYLFPSNPTAKPSLALCVALISPYCLTGRKPSSYLLPLYMYCQSSVLCITELVYGCRMAVMYGNSFKRVLFPHSGILFVTATVGNQITTVVLGKHDLLLAIHQYSAFSHSEHCVAR